MMPGLRAWIKQRGDLPGFLVNARQVMSFVEAASVAREGEVGGGVGTAVLAGTDVIDVEGSEWGVALVESAVFAAIRCALPHQSADRSIHQDPRRLRGSFEPWPAVWKSGQSPQHRLRTPLALAR